MPDFILYEAAAEKINRKKLCKKYKINLLSFIEADDYILLLCYFYGKALRYNYDVFQEIKRTHLLTFMYLNPNNSSFRLENNIIYLLSV